MFKVKKENYNDDYRVINNLRCLAIDMIDKVESGHPGICLGAATILYTLYSRHLSFKRDKLDWYNRDRFILSAGHGAPLLYANLYMLGLISLDDVKALRQLGSITPGHPELITPLVDMATGPLGQGVASAVGMAIGERYLNATYNKNLLNHYTYVLCGDGDLMEGISYEALSLASKLNLNKLIVLYDSNGITLDSELSKSNKEDIIKRFKALNFNILVVNDGDSVFSIDNAITEAKKSNRPSIIIVKTVIGKYSFNAGTNLVHGKPLSKEDITHIKSVLNIYDSPFSVSNEAIKYYQNKVDSRMYIPYKDWQRKYNNLKDKEREKLDKLFNNENTFKVENIDINYQDRSLRDISHDILNDIALKFNLIIGGSADLSSSCKTNLDDLGIFDSSNYKGRNIYFGIREHAMAAIINGMALSHLRPFASTFLVFSDYMRPAIRMSALMNLPVLYILTHDSITVGEDGKTHQPIEQLASLELIPNLYIYRPYDVNELLSCYKEIYQNNRPSILVLPRENREVSELTKSNLLKNGAYILQKEETDDYSILLASGEELGLIIQLYARLKSLGYDIRLVSIPCYQNFVNNTLEYQENILPHDKKIIGITYGVSDYYYRFTKDVLGLNDFGDSGKKNDLLKHFAFDLDSLEERVLKIIGGERNE